LAMVEHGMEKGNVGVIQHHIIFRVLTNVR
jgi:hypothetical protein